jgi:uncharacterized membrane protein YfcA
VFCSIALGAGALVGVLGGLLGIDGGFVGFISAMLGVGVAGLGVPLMTVFSVPVRNAVAAASLLGAIAAVPATLRFIFGGWGYVDLAPWSLGYVKMTYLNPKSGQRGSAPMRNSEVS